MAKVSTGGSASFVRSTWVNDTVFSSDAGSAVIQAGGGDAGRGGSRVRLQVHHHHHFRTMCMRSKRYVAGCTTWLSM